MNTGNFVKVVILDNNLQMIDHIKDNIEDNDLHVVGKFDNVEDTLNFIKENHTDIIISDIVLSKEDGFSFLNKLNNCNLFEKPKVIILSALSNDNFISKALSLGASYYMVKPCDYTTLKTRIMEFALNKFDAITNVETNTKSAIINPIKNKQLEERISNIFITVGIPAHIKGYQFLREAIKMAIDNPEIINSITKKLYPSIAERFDTSSSKVERAIRHAIEVAWNRGKIENINNLFGIRVYSNNEKPTNGEFIALVADKMLIEGA